MVVLLRTISNEWPSLAHLEAAGEVGSHRSGLFDPESCAKIAHESVNEARIQRVRIWHKMLDPGAEWIVCCKENRASLRDTQDQLIAYRHPRLSLGAYTHNEVKETWNLSKPRADDQEQTRQLKAVVETEPILCLYVPVMATVFLLRRETYLLVEFVIRRRMKHDIAVGC